MLKPSLMKKLDKELTNQVTAKRKVTNEEFRKPIPLLSKIKADDPKLNILLYII